MLVCCMVDQLKLINRLFNVTLAKYAKIAAPPRANDTVESFP